MQSLIKLDENFSFIVKYCIFTAVQLACQKPLVSAADGCIVLWSGFLAALYMKCQTLRAVLFWNAKIH